MSALESEIDQSAYYHVAYENHDIMNPLGDERYIALGSLCGLGSSSRVLDIGSGNGHAALLLVQAFDCFVEQVDVSEKWTARAAALFAGHNLLHRTAIHCADAAGHAIPAGGFDLIICFGTAQVFGGFRKALLHILPGLRPGGCIIVAEPSIDVPIPRAFSAWLRESGWVIPSTVEYLRVIDRLALDILGVFRSTPAEWDAYMALQWKAVIDHLRANPRDEDAILFRAHAREEQEMYLRYQRHLMNWDVYVLRK